MFLTFNVQVKHIACCCCSGCYFVVGKYINCLLLMNWDWRWRCLSCNYSHRHIIRKNDQNMQLTWRCPVFRKSIVNNMLCILCVMKKIQEIRVLSRTYTFIICLPFCVHRSLKCFMGGSLNFLSFASVYFLYEKCFPNFLNQFL